MKVVTFHISPKMDLEEAWTALALDGCELLYSSEGIEGNQELIGSLPFDMDQKKLMEKHPCILSISETGLGEIDWESQWALHGADYLDGYIHVDVESYAPNVNNQWPEVLRLQAGPGFGDLSHPTTRLVMQLMGSKIADQHVLDVGCGSGILSLAALAMGAKTVCGIDIDEEALEHARQNAAVNGMEKAILFGSAEACCQQVLKPSYVVLMNMIQIEQVEAWQSVSAFHPYVEMVISSGVLAEGREVYLKQCWQWGWKLLEEKEEDGWLGFVFKM